MRRWLYLTLSRLTAKVVPLVKRILVSPETESRLRKEREIKQYIAVTERHYEYPFVVQNIIKLGKTNHIHSILDVGCTGSHLPLILAAMGWEVTGSDLNKWEVSHKNFTMVTDDIKKSKFPNESFDLVTAVSTIEHIGTPRYGEKKDLRGDKNAVREIYRILRKGGFFIITVPFGRAMINPLYKFRVYDAQAFRILTEGFNIMEQAFIGPIRQLSIYERCTEEETYKIRPSAEHPGLHCTTLAVFQKPV